MAVSLTSFAVRMRRSGAGGKAGRLRRGAHLFSLVCGRCEVHTDGLPDDPRRSSTRSVNMAKGQQRSNREKKKPKADKNKKKPSAPAASPFTAQPYKKTPG
jgi:hypothetical protein